MSSLRAMESFKTLVIGPLWRALKRLFQPDVRIVTGGIAFYALFSIFPLIYLTLALLGLFLPEGLAGQLFQPISEILASGVDPLSQREIAVISDVTPEGLTLSAVIALLLVLFTASSGAKAAMTGIRMIAGSTRPNRILRFNGASFLLTGILILSIWVLGLAQLIVTGFAKTDASIAVQFASELARIADALWVTKFIGSYLIFFAIISVSLRGHVEGWRARGLGAAIGAIAWIAVTFGFQLYLKYSALDSLYGALASVIIGFIWLAASVSCLLYGAAAAIEYAAVLFQEDEPDDPALAAASDT